MPIDYKTYEDFRKNFKVSQRWELFDGNRDNLNIATECVDRHPKDKTAIRIKFSDGRRETYTFGELSRLTSQFAHTLERLGVNKGDRIAIALSPSIGRSRSMYRISPYLLLSLITGTRHSIKEIPP